MASHWFEGFRACFKYERFETSLGHERKKKDFKIRFFQ